MDVFANWMYLDMESRLCVIILMGKTMLKHNESQHKVQTKTSVLLCVCQRP